MLVPATAVYSSTQTNLLLFFFNVTAAITSSSGLIRLQVAAQECHQSYMRLDFCTAAFKPRGIGKLSSLRPPAAAGFTQQPAGARRGVKNLVFRYKYCCCACKCGPCQNKQSALLTSPKRHLLRRSTLVFLLPVTPSGDRISRTSAPGSGRALLFRSQIVFPSRPTSSFGSDMAAAIGQAAHNSFPGLRKCLSGRTIS